MKKLIQLLFLLTTSFIYAQAASKINNAQNIYSSGQPRVIVSADTLPGGLWRTYPKDLVTWKFSQITNLPNTLSGYGIVNGVPITRTINGYNLSTDITLSKVDIGLNNVDNTSDLNKPISTATQTALDTKLSSINSSQVTTALGYTPINPNGNTSQYFRGDGSLSTFPTIPAAQVNVDWNSASGITQILNKPILATVATTGVYNDLTGKPTIPTNTNQLTNGAGFITGYTETDSTVPAYAKTLTGFSVIKASTDPLYYPLSGNPSNFLTSVPAQSFSSLTGKPSTLSGYGITDGVINTRTINGYALTSNITLTKSDIGLGNVDNTSDLNKPISTATQTALNGKLSAEVDGSVTNELQTLSISGSNLSISSGNTVALPIPVDYTNTVAVAGGGGNSVFYLTSDKTSTGTALYTNINYVSPLVNDSTINYTYGWSYNSGTKALTVNVKQSTGLFISLLNLTLLGTPTNVANGTNVQVLVKGN